MHSGNCLSDTAEVNIYSFPYLCSCEHSKSVNISTTPALSALLTACQVAFLQGMSASHILFEYFTNARRKKTKCVELQQIIWSHVPQKNPEVWNHKFRFTTNSI